MVGSMKDQARGSVPGRRHHERAFKDDLVAQSLVPGASVAAIAMKVGINANQLFKWRREHARRGALTQQSTPTLLPVCVIPDARQTSVGQAFSAQPVAVGDSVAHRNSDLQAGVIEIEIAGAQLRLLGRIDETTLSGVLRASPSSCRISRKPTMCSIR